MKKHVLGLLNTLFGALLVLIVVVTSAISARVDVMMNMLNEIPAVEELEIDEMLIATYKDANGIEHVIKTEQRDDESAADLVARHKAKITAMVAEFPPVG